MGVESQESVDESVSSSQDETYQIEHQTSIGGSSPIGQAIAPSLISLITAEKNGDEMLSVKVDTKCSEP